MKKGFVVIIISLVFAMGLVGCSSKATKAVGQAKLEIENEKYSEALSSLQLALKENPEHEEAKNLYSIINGYFEVKKLIEIDDISEAKKLLSSLNSEYKGLKIKGEIELLSSQVNKRASEIEANSNKLNLIIKLVDEKKYVDADKELSGINIKVLTKDQKLKATELSDKVKDSIAKIELEKKKKQEALLVEKANSEVSGGKITEDKAIELVIGYMEKNNPYVSKGFVVEEERNTEYLVRAFDDMGTHIATSGWYLVNKKTGKVKMTQ
ncbi:MAG: tetratricopeptide repeat protein [Clostridium sp.]